jgi:hypothetical protein
MSDISSFAIRFVHYSDGSVKLSVNAEYTVFDSCPCRRDRWNLLHVNYNSYKNDYSRITNLCTAQRFSNVSHGGNVFDSHSQGDVWELYTVEYGFLYAEEVRRVIAALDFYDIEHDYRKLIENLPF